MTFHFKKLSLNRDEIVFAHEIDFGPNLFWKVKNAVKIGILRRLS